MNVLAAPLRLLLGGKILTSSAKSLSPGAAVRRPALARRTLNPPRAPSWGTESPRANFLLRQEASRCDRVPTQSLRAEAYRIRAPQGRIRSAIWLHLRTSPVREKSFAECPGDEYGSIPIPVRSRSARRHRPAPAPRSASIADRSPTPRPAPADSYPHRAEK